MLAFVHIKKTAGTTLTAILRRNFGTRHLDTRLHLYEDLFLADDLRRALKLYRRLDCIAGHHVRPFGDLHSLIPKIRYFTFVREPISRLVSDFQFKLSCLTRRGIQPRDTMELFHTWLKGQRNLQVRSLAGCEDSDEAIRTIRQQIGFVGQAERFDDSLVMWRRWTQNADLDLRYRSLNKSSSSQAKNKYFLREQMDSSEQLRKIVQEANLEDLKLYRWVRDELFPRQIEEYGEQILATETDELRRANQELHAWRADSVAGRIFRNLLYRPLKPLLGVGRTRAA